jgi:nitrogen fixation-related uncharacterized protein
MFGVSKRSISPNIRVMIVPIVAIIVVFVLSIFLLKEAYARISSQYSDLQSTRKDETVLRQKAETLRQLRDGGFDPGERTALALPNKNPSLWVLSNINRELREKERIIINELNASGTRKLKDAEDVNKGKFTVVFYYLDVLEFIDMLNQISTYTPYTSYEFIDFEVSDKGYIESKVEFNVFWSEMPKTITSIRQPVDDLSSKEKEILNLVTRLKTPELSTIEAVSPYGRENPFR